jgi:hypothetical protein
MVGPGPALEQPVHAGDAVVALQHAGTEPDIGPVGLRHRWQDVGNQAAGQARGIVVLARADGMAASGPASAPIAGFVFPKGRVGHGESFNRSGYGTKRDRRPGENKGAIKPSAPLGAGKRAYAARFSSAGIIAVPMP